MNGSVESVESISESLRLFSVLDYAVFVVMLVVCSCIGLFFGFKDHVKHKANKSQSRRDSETLDYLLGGQNVQVFPVAMSLVASFVSGVTLLGASTEIYVYGVQYAYTLLAPIIMGIFMHYITIPVFYDLKVVSMFEYLERRFDMRMRLFGSLIQSVSAIAWFPIVIYVPALAFNQTTGIDIHIITPVVMSICIFYTCLGGIKAVIWTDVIQIVLMYGVMILINVKGTIDAGGLRFVIEKNLESGRLEAPDFRIDPTLRHTFWTVFVGGSWYWIIVNTNQTAVQRFLSLKDLKTAQKACMMYIVGIIILIAMCMYNGLILYGTYHDCDPLTTKLAKKEDQLIPLLVMKILKDIPGLPGLFIAGVFSAALSSLSSGLNSMSALVLEDYFKPMFKKGLSKRATGLIMRGTVVILGVVSVALVYVVENLGPVLELSMSLPATCVGSLFGIFSIGMFLPWIGKRAAFYGALIAAVLMIYWVARAQIDSSRGLVVFDTKPTSVEGCKYNFTLTETSTTSTPLDDKQEKAHHMSYLYYMPVGALITCLSAFILSFFFGFDDPNDVDPSLLAPFMRKYFPAKSFQRVAETDNAEELSVDNLEMSKKQIE